jgi:hypothetical protein
MPYQAREIFLPILRRFRDRLQQYGELELLIGFPPAPFILPLVANDRVAFIAHSMLHPSHTVAIHRRRIRDKVEWVAFPVHNDGAYQLSFTLPSGIEEWIADNEKRRRDRTWMIKNNFLATITIYYETGEELRVCHLRYEPGFLLSGG